AGQIAALYDAGFIKATSVGFMIHEDGTLELLEFSFVPVPANPYALSMRQMKKLNLDIPQLVMKGLRFETKIEQVGDHCEMDDGSPGVLAEDANNPGELVCVPTKSAKSNQDMNNDLTKALTAEHTRHSESVAKAIVDFSEKCFPGEKALDGTEYTKAIEEFAKTIDGEHDTHLEKCQKA